jgi:hypothetical protein
LPSRPPALDGVSSGYREISDSDDGDDLPSVEKVLARSKRMQSQMWPPGSKIDISGESDDDNTMVRLHGKNTQVDRYHVKANALPAIGYF